MDKKILMNHLQKLKKEEVLTLLDSSFDSMTVQQRDRVFYETYQNVSYPQIDLTDLKNRINSFVKDSHDGIYCAPFDINSKNYMDIPEETEEWFDLMGDLLLETAELSKQGNYKSAIELFSTLFKLVEAMEAYEDDIIFAKRYNSSMIPIKMEIVYEQYIVSVSKSYKNSSKFLEYAIYLFDRSKNDSFFGDFEKMIKKRATTEQYQQFQDFLKTEK